jgi:hypothetical protein
MHAVLSDVMTMRPLELVAECLASHECVRHADRRDGVQGFALMSHCLVATIFATG